MLRGISSSFLLGYGRFNLFYEGCCIVDPQLCRVCADLLLNCIVCNFSGFLGIQEHAVKLHGYFSCFDKILTERGLDC